MAKGFAYRPRKRKPPPPPPAVDPLSEEEEESLHEEEEEQTLGRRRKSEEKLPKPGKRVRLETGGGLQYKKRKQTPPSTPPSSRKTASPQIQATPSPKTTPLRSTKASSTPKSTPKSSSSTPKPAPKSPKAKTHPKSPRNTTKTINISDTLRDYVSTIEPKSKKSGPAVSFLHKFIEEFEDEFEAFQRQENRLQKRKREFEENEREILIHQQKQNIKRLKEETQRIQAKTQVWEDLHRSQLDDLARRGGSNSGVQCFEDYRQILSQPDFRYVEVNKLVPSPASKPSLIDPLGLTADKNDVEKALESFHTKVLRLGSFISCLENFCTTANDICNNESKMLQQRSFAPYKEGSAAAQGTSSLLKAVANAK